MKQTQYNFFLEPHREKTVFPYYNTSYFLLFIIRFIRKKKNSIFNCLYCNIVAGKKTNKNLMPTFQGAS